ncbi:uncharacterized protein KIAA1614 homolog [Rhynchocyon petersi]
MEMTVGERRDPELLLENGHLHTPWLHLQEDRTPSRTGSQTPKAQPVPLQGMSVLEFKVRALKEKRTLGKEGPSTSCHEQPSSKKPKCRRVKAGVASASVEGTSVQDVPVATCAQSLTSRQLDSCVNEEKSTSSRCSRSPRAPAPRWKCWSGKNSWPLEAAWTLPDHEQGLRPGPGIPVHSAALRQPGGSGPCNKITHIPTLRKGKSYPLQDDLATGRDLESTPWTSEEDFTPRTPLLRSGCRAGELGVLGTGGSALSLSDLVERNRLLLQEMLNVSGKRPPKPSIQAWTSSWDGAVPELPVRDVDWASGVSLQDMDHKRTFGSKQKPGLSPQHEEAKHLLQHARMKARTRPLRASHDIVPTIAQGSRKDRRNPASDARTAIPCRDSPQNGNLSDSSSGESSSGLWPKRGASTSTSSHVRFEDESARDVESRYMERLQQRHRQVLSSVLQAVDQGPLRSKPDLTSYINGGLRRREPGAGAPNSRDLLSPTQGERKCRACGHLIEQQRPKDGKAPPVPGLSPELQRACRVEGTLAEPHSAQSLSFPSRILLAEPGLHAQWVRETHIGDILCPEDADSALDSTDNSDSGRTDSEEAGTSPSSRARCRTRKSKPRGHRWSRRVEPPWDPQNHHLLEVDHEVGDEEKEGRGYTPAGILLPMEDRVPQPSAPESGRASLRSQGQAGAGLGNRWAPCRPACTSASSVSSGLLGPSRQAQVLENHESLDGDAMFSLQQSHVEPPAPCQAQQPAASFSLEGWVPTPPSSRKTVFPSGPLRKAVLVGPHKTCGHGHRVDTALPSSQSVAPRPCELTAPQTQPCSPQVRHPLWTLSVNNCNNSLPQGTQESWGEAASEGRMEVDHCSQEPEPPTEDSSEGGPQCSPSPAVIGTTSSTSTALPLASEEPEPSQEPEGSPKRTELRSGGCTPLGASPGVGAGPGPVSAAPAEQQKKSSSITSALGLKKFFSVLGQSTRPKLGKSRSYSVEELQSPVPGSASHTSTPKVKRAPSLQSLHLVSPSHQHRKAASFQNLHSLLSPKVDRSSLYLVGDSDPSATGRQGQAPPRRALSVEDVSAPSLARTVGRVVEVYPDGTSQLQLQRSPGGTFGFSVASGDGRRDSGIYVQEMADASTAKLYSGLLGVGDELLEVNGAKVAGLGLAHIEELLAHSESLLVRVLRQRPAPR